MHAHAQCTDVWCICASAHSFDQHYTPPTLHASKTTHAYSYCSVPGVGLGRVQLVGQALQLRAVKPIEARLSAILSVAVSRSNEKHSAMRVVTSAVCMQFSSKTPPPTPVFFRVSTFGHLANALLFFARCFAAATPRRCHFSPSFTPLRLSRTPPHSRLCLRPRSALVRYYR